MMTRTIHINPLRGRLVSDEKGQFYIRLFSYLTSAASVRTYPADMKDWGDLPPKKGNEDVPRSLVFIDDVEGHGPISFSGQSFPIGKAMWNTCMITYTSKDGTHDFVQVPDVVIECKSGESYATPQKRDNGESKSKAFIKVHVPKDSYCALFKPATKLANYKTPNQVSRTWGDDAEPSEYCVMFPKYPDTLRTWHDNCLQDVRQGCCGFHCCT
jgi:hypothetical protein